MMMLFPGASKALTARQIISSAARHKTASVGGRTRAAVTASHHLAGAMFVVLAAVQQNGPLLALR